MKPGYKQTEVGVIPEEWEALPARDIGVFKGGSGFPLTAQGDASGDYPFFKVSDMNNEGNETFMMAANNYISEQSRKRLGAIAFPKDSIVFAKIGAAVFLERKRILGQPSCIDNNMAAFVLDTTCADVRYVHSLLLSRRLGALVATTALPALSGKSLGEMMLAVPPLPEQRAIATALSDMDALLGALDRLIAKKRDLKQAAMQQLLTGQTRLPGFSGEWEVKRLGDVLTICHGKSQREVVVADGPYPILATGGQIGTAARPLYDKPSVLIGRKGTINQPQYMDIPFWTVDTLFYSAMKNGNDAKFFYYRFCLIDWMQFNEASGVPSLNARTIEKIEFACPEPPEQTAIAAVLSDMDAEIAALEARRAKTRDLKQAMMQELLTGRTRLVEPERAA